ncbi:MULTISPECIES: hypothetical protein [unclassified Pseudoalteromonas]|uniref:hypothetical protein n=1 Tax=unclassified Pseudoalteromonas TaxID=194690 RepID=UPI00209707BB|nr:hypothetical protein [Pseudoalteromonas sp. XMcav2-N]MCO7188202.1 hypothetical protein [Pseudoalteromonas sp. XMcav2-N]
MKLSGSHDNPRAVQGATACLRTQHIHCRVVRKNGQWPQAINTWQECVTSLYHDQYLDTSWQLPRRAHHWYIREFG